MQEAPVPFDNQGFGHLAHWLLVGQSYTDANTFYGRDLGDKNTYALFNYKIQSLN